MKDNINKPEEAFYFWSEDDGSKKEALSASADSLQEYVYLCFPAPSQISSLDWY